jgi:anti-sigma factor RsiW
MGMEQSAINETLVRQYLLGLLSEDEHERLEMSLLTDDRIYETLTALEDEVEDELIDQYLDGELTAPERDKFEHDFLKKPERDYKLKHIKDLKDNVMLAPQAEITSQKNAPANPTGNWIPT